MKINSPVISMALVLGAAYFVWSLAGHANTRLAALPVAQPAMLRASVSTIESKPLYPATAVVVRQRHVAAGGADVDAVFGQAVSEPAAVDLPAGPDYAAAFATALQLQGVTEHGAFISGRFYRVGSPMAGLAVQRADGSPLVPVLAAVSADSVAVVADGSRITVRLRGGTDGMVE